MTARLHHIGERFMRKARKARLLTRVLFVAFRGLYKASRAQHPVAGPALRKHRCAAHRQLWAKLENVYWKLRESNSDALTLRALLRDVDAFVANNFASAPETDQALLARYIQSLHRLREVSVQGNESRVAVAWRSDGGPHPNTLAAPAGVQEAVDLRNRVLQKLRHTLSSN
jgi:hypothetical protein